MANEKQMGRTNLEEALKRQFPNDDIDKLLEKIDNVKNSMKLDAEENPFFYGRVLQEISLSQSTNISEWIDANGVAKIQSIAKFCKEEKTKEKQEQEEKIKKEEDQLQETLDENREDDVKNLKEFFDNIDYENLDADTLLTVLEHFDVFYEEQSSEEVENILNAAQKTFDTNEVYAKMLVLAKKIEEYKNNGQIYEYNAEDLEVLDMAQNDKELSIYVKSDPNGNIIVNQEKLKDSVEIASKVIIAMETAKRLGQELNTESIVSSLKNTSNTNDRELRTVVGLVVSNKALEEINNLSESEFYDHLNGRLSQEHNKQSNSFNITEQLQRDNDQEMDNRYQYAQDYYIPKEKQASNETLEENVPAEVTNEKDNLLDVATDELAAALQVYDMEEESKQEGVEQIGQTQEEIQSEENLQVGETVNETQPVQEDDYIKDVQEEENKTGLAGIFAGVKDKVTNFFKRVNQKALPSPENQKEVGGSLVPMNFRLRNALTTFSVSTIGNAMQALGKLVGINNREQAKNTIPTEVIKSENLEMEQNKQQENSINDLLQNNELLQNSRSHEVVQNANFRDNNPWAVQVTENMEEKAIEQSQEAAKRAENGEIVQTNEDMSKE